MEQWIENDIPALVKCLGDKLERRANRDLAQYGVTSSQVSVLVVLNRAEDGCCALKMLEKRFQVSQQTMAGIILRLEKKELVKGVADPLDRRVKKVQITSEGRQLVNDVWKKKAAVEQELFACLEEQEQVILRQLLRRLCGM